MKVNLKMRQHQFSVEDKNMSIGFLALFVRETNTWQMSDAQLFVALPTFVAKFAKIQHSVGVKIVAQKEGALSSWPKAQQFHPRDYARSS